MPSSQQQSCEDSSVTPEYTRRAKRKKRAPPGLHTTPSSSGYGSNYSTPSSNDGKTSKLFRSMSSDLSEQLALILFNFVTHLNQGCYNIISCMQIFCSKF